MKLRLKSKSVKNSNYFNMKIASKTFKKLIERNKENKLKNKKILLNKTEHFFLMLNKEFFKEEIKENDHDYIYREIKHMQKYHQTLVDLYGKDAYKKSIDDYSEPIKYDKKLLFNPFNKNKNENKYKIFTKEVKNMYLPKLHLCSIGAQVTYAQACGGALQIRFGIMQHVRTRILCFQPASVT